MTKIEWCNKLLNRFRSYVNRTSVDDDNCWLWKAGCFQNGYGQFRVGKKKLKAHRVAWETEAGPIPDGMCVLHKCDNPRCVRFTHLFLGTHKDNAIDRMVKGRGATGKQHGMHTKPHKRSPGEKNGAAKLTWEKVKTIRELHEVYGYSYTRLAIRFGVSASCVAFVCRYETWRNF